MKFAELHIHLDGAIRLETLFELAKKKMSDVKNIKEYAKYVCLDGKPKFSSLTECLDMFHNVTKIIKGDKTILERVAFEFCEDQYNNNMIYTEVRYNPHILQGDLTLDEVIESINKGLQRGMKKYPILVNSILCCLRHLPEWSEEIVLLADKYRNKGVVGVDLAGDEIKFPNDLHIKAFDLAKKKNINITVHAGETGNYNNIISAINDLHAQRIGHGYALINNVGLVDMIKKNNIHIEACPTSSLKTNSMSDLKAIKLFKNNDLSYSINTDDPSIFEVKFSEEIQIMKDVLKMNNKMLKKITINTIDAAFISEEQKKMLKKQIDKI